MSNHEEKHSINGHALLMLALLDPINGLDELERLFTDYNNLKELSLFHQFIYHNNYNQNKEDSRIVIEKLDKMFINSIYGYQAHMIIGDEGYSAEGLQALFQSESGNNGTNTLSEIPTEYKLYNNYPNPFNPTTTIKYSVPKVSNVKLKIYNAMGQLVKTLVSETKAPGLYFVEWNGTDVNSSKVASGIYFYKLESYPLGSTEEGFVSSKKMILLK